MAEIFKTKPEDEKRIHPYALKRFNDWKAMILREIPQLNRLGIDEVNADINSYLDDNEKTNIEEYRINIFGWLFKCTDIGDGYSTYPYSEWVINSMLEFKLLLKKVYERKEKEENWIAAYKAVNPPMEDARKYLKENEYKEFNEQLNIAIEVYLEKGEQYREDYRTVHYNSYLRKLKIHKDTQIRSKIAKLEAADFNRWLLGEIEKRKSQLHPERVDHASYFQENIKDPRYLGNDFSYLLPENKENEFDKAIIGIAKSRVEKSIPADLFEFFDGQLSTSYVLLPAADYVLIDEIPCLYIGFSVFAVAEIKLWAKPGQKRFDFHTADLPWVNNEKGKVFLEKPKFLGYDYFIATPRSFNGYFKWKAIPLILVQGLLNGEIKPEGTTITGLSGSKRRYEVDGFKDEVVIPQGFIDYLTKVGSFERLADIGVISSSTAELISGLNLSEITRNKMNEEQVTGFTDKDFISQMASLGFSNKAASELLRGIPRHITLDEAIRFALSRC